MSAVGTKPLVNMSKDTLLMFGEEEVEGRFQHGKLIKELMKAAERLGIVSPSRRSRAFLVVPTMARIRV